MMIFDGGQVRTMPEPQGSGRKGLRVYDFDEVVKGRYISQGNKIITIGKKFQFKASMLWEGIGKVYMKYLFDAQNQKKFKIRLNADKEELEYEVRVVSLKHEPYEGLTGGISPGYTARLQLEGTELLNQAGYGALGLSEGYGTGYGTDYGNQ